MTRFFMLLIAILFLSCKGKKHDRPDQFDKEKWLVKEGKEYIFRNDMLHDLVYNYKWKGLTKDSVLRMLGTPDRTESLYLYYTVSQKFIGDFIPLHTRSLVIKLKEDSTVEWRKIHE